MTTELPDKKYFKIGEVARIAGVKPSVLRYWETEFRSIRPEKSRSNQRLYARRHVERILQIRELLYVKKYTIEGARRRLREAEGPDGSCQTDGPSLPSASGAHARSCGSPGNGEGDRALLEQIKKEVEELLQLVVE
ncbi:MAG: MerR family transcriptional regulator [Deltaproteobacteria bacterium]|nr:MerR family transcriptional regulator [Deltaproteobacteria bacterium]